MSIDETIISSLEDIQHEQETEPYLIIVAGSSIGKLYHLHAPELGAGRSANCDIRIQNNTACAIRINHVPIILRTVAFIPR